MTHPTTNIYSGQNYPLPPRNVFQTKNSWMVCQPPRITKLESSPNLVIKPPGEQLKFISTNQYVHSTSISSKQKTSLPHNNNAKSQANLMNEHKIDRGSQVDYNSEDETHYSKIPFIFGVPDLGVSKKPGYNHNFPRAHLNSPTSKSVGFHFPSSPTKHLRGQEISKHSSLDATMPRGSNNDIVRPEKATSRNAKVPVRSKSFKEVGNPAKNIPFKRISFQ